MWKNMHVLSLHVHVVNGCSRFLPVVYVASQEARPHKAIHAEGLHFSACDLCHGFGQIWDRQQGLDNYWHGWFSLPSQQIHIVLRRRLIKECDCFANCCYTFLILEIRTPFLKTSLIRTPHWPGHLTNQDTSLISTPHWSGHLTSQDTSLVRTTIWSITQLLYIYMCCSSD